MANQVDEFQGRYQDASADGVTEIVRRLVFSHSGESGAAMSSLI